MGKYIVLFLIVIILSIQALLAQAPSPADTAAPDTAQRALLGWRFSAMAGLNFASTHVSRNWLGQEQNVWMASAFVDGTAERSFRWLVWKSRLSAEYGQSKFGSSDVIKGSDLIHSDSYLRWKVLPRFNPYADLTFDSQFDVLLKPMVLIQSLGMSAYLLDQPGRTLSTRAGLALKEVYDPGYLLSRPLNLTVMPQSSDSGTTRLSLGATSVTALEYTLGSSAKLASELRLFAPAGFKGADMRWETTLYVKLTSYVSLKVGYLALFDYNPDYPPVWPRDIRNKLTTGLGASWNIF